MREPSTRTLRRPRLQFFEFAERLPQIFLGAEDAHQILHRLLQIAVNGVGTFALGALERREHSPARPLRFAASSVVGALLCCA